MTDAQWFQDAKYGLFIHFGLYAIPGGMWKGEKSPHGSEWIMKNMRIPLAEYRKLKYEFNPQKFDAKRIVKMAQNWGMRYLCITAKHHDGFAMYDSHVSSYTIMHTPYGKDLVKELADACHAASMPFCIYYSQMQDWEDENGNGNTWDYDKEKQNFKVYFDNKVLPQIKELLTNYGEVSMLWFDTPYDMPEELCKLLRNTVKEYQPKCLINGRIGYGLGDFREAADNQIPRFSMKTAWEVPMTLNGSWGYSSYDSNYKTEKQVIENLLSVSEKGGNLILNVGPNADGVIPEESCKILDHVGEWLKKNGDAFFYSESSPDFPYLIPFGGVTYNSQKKTLYLHVTKYPAFPYRILLTGLKTPVESVTLLSGVECHYAQSYEPARDEDRLYVFLPEKPEDPYDTIVKVVLKKDIQVQSIR